MRQFRVVLLQEALWLMVLFLVDISSGTSEVTLQTHTGVVQDQEKDLLSHPDSSEDFEDDHSQDSNLELNKISKRSTHDYEDASDHYGNWDPDSSNLDSGYESYLQSLQYDPMMAWGRRKRTRGPQYYILPKRNYETATDGYEPYLNHLAERRDNPQDGYMESVYLPHHFFPSFKRALNSDKPTYSKLTKRSPSEMGAKGFHEGIFTHNFGDFSPVRRKRDAEKADIEGDKGLEAEDKNEDSPKPRMIYPLGFAWNNLNKRRFGMDASGFHGDTFSDGWGTFSTMRKRLPEWDYNQGDQFTDGYGFYNGMFKRRPEMDSMGFHGDTFNGGFGDFYTMKRRPEMDSSGFFGDTFSSGFGDFYTMKKRRSDMASQRSKREAVMPKRRPEMTSSGFFGDTFSNGFGDFYTMKRREDKRRPEMTSSGFYGDTFSNGFGDFYTMRKRLRDLNPQHFNRPRYSTFPAGTNAGTADTMNTDQQREPIDKNR